MAARDQTEKDTGVEPGRNNPALDALGDAMREQKERQERLRHVQSFLTSPLFLDMRDDPVTVSDPPEAIEERKRDLDYRIAVLTSLTALLREERQLLDRTQAAGTPVTATNDTRTDDTGANDTGTGASSDSATASQA
jgi:hypothetical protein